MSPGPSSLTPPFPFPSISILFLTLFLNSLFISNTHEQPALPSQLPPPCNSIPPLFLPQSLTLSLPHTHIHTLICSYSLPCLKNNNLKIRLKITPVTSSGARDNNVQSASTNKNARNPQTSCSPKEVGVLPKRNGSEP